MPVAKGIAAGFIAENELKDAVEKLMKQGGKAVVAYVGGSVMAYLPKDAKIDIVCNLNSMGTNPSGVRDLVKRNGNKGFYLDNLHAKVYVGKEGVIVCSANLSTNGLEVFEESESGLVEAGFFIPADKPEAKKARIWVDEIFDRASGNPIKFSKAEWDRRIKSYNSRKKSGKKIAPPVTVSFKDIVDHPDRYAIFLWQDGEVETKGKSLDEESILRKQKEKQLGLTSTGEISSYEVGSPEECGDDYRQRMLKYGASKIFISMKGHFPEDDDYIPSRFDMRSGVNLYTFVDANVFAKHDGTNEVVAYCDEGYSAAKLDQKAGEKLRKMLTNSLRRADLWSKWKKDAIESGIAGISGDHLKKMLKAGASKKS